MNSPAQPNLSVVRFLLEVAGRGGPRPHEDEGVGEAFWGDHADNAKIRLSDELHHDRPAPRRRVCGNLIF